MNSEATADQLRVLEQRAERLRKRPRDAGDDAVRWLADITVGQERYAIELDRLRAAVPLRSVRATPLAPPHVIGILRFQGQLITALSFASLLGVRGWHRDPNVLLVVEYGPQRGLVAFDSEITPVPRALPLALVEEARRRDEGQAFYNITTPELVRVQLVDLDRLLASWREGIDAR
ncbi:MAG: chemotaxis protein CheW [Kofleriaceae bacterium]